MTVKEEREKGELNRSICANIRRLSMAIEGREGSKIAFLPRPPYMNEKETTALAFPTGFDSVPLRNPSQIATGRHTDFSIMSVAIPCNAWHPSFPSTLPSIESASPNDILQVITINGPDLNDHLADHYGIKIEMAYENISRFGSGLEIREKIAGMLGKKVDEVRLVAAGGDWGFVLFKDALHSELR